ncbi:capsular exopolysaccharide synthesis family protein [Natranaerovirga pectinivora]|uniref:non-specific protein-tyrosine kinase n=1 Tax=Natranaerovirga pectinivora TaxID=682400 RepID=A0A4R3MGR3_9FIRM|nr:CpsD/CapB family tyrosine-protein kinase [Natranaerovirga pectinivora]TCT12830.1 capsular exopolysaccharide synthesis family protein [Natranaerovirga pectinivora]
MNINKNLITLRDPKAPVSEAYRMIRTNLQYTNIDRQNKLIAFTSSSTEEGKTTTISNVAITMAQAGYKVLLIDCDLRKSRLHKTFNLRNHLGLTSIIVEKKPLSEVAQTVEEIENLYVITAGAMPPDPAELIASQSMQSFLKEVRDAYDIVLIDTPPILSVTDAAILSGFVDGMILIFAADQTNIEAAKVAKKSLEKVNANILGAVLTKANMKKLRNYYYYYDYKEKPESEKKKRKDKKKNK